MKRNKLVRVLALVMTCGLIAVTSSCKKTTAVLPKTTTQLLTQAPWREIRLEYENQDGTWIEKPVPSEVSSATNVFNVNGTYNVISSTGDAVSSGTWVIIGDNTQLALNLSITYTFSILNDSTMQLLLIGQIPYADPETNITCNYWGMRQTFNH